MGSLLIGIALDKHLIPIADYLALSDLAGFVLNSPLLSTPGETFHYNNAATHLLGIILTKSTGKDVLSLAQKNLFDPLGITAVEWAKTKDGYYDLAGLENIRLRTADWIKIGSLLLQEGKYGGKQIVPQKWRSTKAGRTRMRSSTPDGSSRRSSRAFFIV